MNSMSKSSKKKMIDLAENFQRNVLKRTPQLGKLIDSHYPIAVPNWEWIESHTNLSPRNYRRIIKLTKKPSHTQNPNRPNTRKIPHRR